MNVHGFHPRLSYNGEKKMMVSLKNTGKVSTDVGNVRLNAISFQPPSVLFGGGGGMDLGQWTTVPQYVTACGGGFGMAACPSMGLLVTSNVDDDTLCVVAAKWCSGYRTGS